VNTSPEGLSEDSADWRDAEQSLDRLRRQLSENTYAPAKTHQLFGSTITRTVNAGCLLTRQQFARLQKCDLIRPLRLARTSIDVAWRSARGQNSRIGDQTWPPLFRFRARPNRSFLAAAVPMWVLRRAIEFCVFASKIRLRTRPCHRLLTQL
jgi:hypothetical protein